MRELATSIVLLALSVPALALGQLTEISPLLAKPSLSFDAEPETGWVAETVGHTLLEPHRLFILERPGCGAIGYCSA